ncbi:MAG: oxidoreductase, partial [Gemmatimonadales bacterium]
VRFTLGSPGATDTRLWDAYDPDSRDDLPARSDMMHPEDVAAAIVFAVRSPPRANVSVLRLG